MRNIIHCIGLLFALHSGLVAGADTTPVSVVEVSARDVSRQIRVTGNVTSPHQAALSASVEGLIQTYHVDVGDRVKPGAILVQLDSELAALQLNSSQARQREAQSALDDALRRLREAEKLSGESGVIAATEVESRRTEVALARAALAVAEAEVSYQRSILARHTINAPFAGVVSMRLAEIGEWLNRGEALLELVATDDLHFDFRLPQEVSTQINNIDSIEVRFDALPDIRVAGRSKAIVPVKNPDDRTFLLRVVAADSNTNESLARITPGMSAQAVISLKTGRTGVSIPRDALLRFADGRTIVWEIQASDATTRVVERKVETGLEFDGMVEILNGLESGARVVVRGNEALRDGQAVEVRTTGAR